jgi:hypothetical protein
LLLAVEILVVKHYHEPKKKERRMWRMGEHES